MRLYTTIFKGCPCRVGRNLRRPSAPLYSAPPYSLEGALLPTLHSRTLDALSRRPPRRTRSASRGSRCGGELQHVRRCSFRGVVRRLGLRGAVCGWWAQRSSRAGCDAPRRRGPDANDERHRAMRARETQRVHGRTARVCGPRSTDPVTTETPARHMK